MIDLEPKLNVRDCKYSRRELKYLITEEQARLVRRFCRDYLPVDSHANGRRNSRYPILSIYFDSPGRALLYQAIDRLPFRFKLRVRTYRAFGEPATNLLAFLEIKRKIKGVVYKTRAAVSSHTASQLIEHGAIGEADRHTQERANVAEFLAMRRRITAQPAVGVCYEREAYEGNTQERVRITLDRNMHCGLLDGSNGTYREVWRPVHLAGVILEVKFTNTYPFWLSNMLHRLELLRRGVCKYVTCSLAFSGRERVIAGR